MPGASSIRGSHPVINTGIAHRQAGVGQIGAGIARAPLRVLRRRPWRARSTARRADRGRRRGHGHRAVIAIGGNALILDGQRGTIEEQYENARETSHHIAALVATGWGVVVTHGNGPQVGFILLRSELVPKDAPVPRLSLEMSVADSQGGIGHILGQALLNEFAARGLPDRVVCVLTHVVVDPDDPAFEPPNQADRPVLLEGGGRPAIRAQRLDDDRGLRPRLSAGSSRRRSRCGSWRGDQIRALVDAGLHRDCRRRRRCRRGRDGAAVATAALRR